MEEMNPMNVFDTVVTPSMEGAPAAEPQSVPVPFIAPPVSVPIPEKPPLLPTGIPEAFSAWISLLIGFLFMRYIVFRPDGILAAAVYWLIFACTDIYLKVKKLRPMLPQRIVGVLLWALSLMCAVSSDIMLHFLCFAMITIMYIWRINAIGSEIGYVTRFFPLDLAGIILKPMGTWNAFSHSLTASFRKNHAGSGKLKLVFLGLLISVPLTVIVGALLSSADSAIEKMFRYIFDQLQNFSLFQDTQLIIAEVICGAFMGYWLFGTLLSAALRKSHPLHSEAEWSAKLDAMRTIPNLVMYSCVTPICLLYLIYVFSQAEFFFSVLLGNAPTGIVYSEYARKGFFELCALAVINLAVILALNYLAKNSGRKRTTAFTVFSTVLCSFTLFIIATALTKMGLYINAYGLTKLRLFTSWFMVMLAVIFLVLMISQFTRRIPTASILLTTFLVLFSVLVFSRPEAVIAKYNISRYENGTLSELDPEVLCDLSVDAYCVMAEHIDVLKESSDWSYFKRELSGRAEYLKEKAQYADTLSAQMYLRAYNSLYLED
ncbi:MAG: DUF4173 domain-containing protein [Oscillospiraceae bacterium]|nr:DUF4173 domain-containing protein [Oscillospiraceae bacterium]